MTGPGLHKFPLKHLLLQTLVFGNFAYAVACLVLLLIFFKTATILGTVYFLVESVLIAALAFLEWTQVKSIAGSRYLKA